MAHVMFECHRGHRYPVKPGQRQRCPECGLRYAVEGPHWVLERGPELRTLEREQIEEQITEDELLDKQEDGSSPWLPPEGDTTQHFTTQHGFRLCTLTRVRRYSGRGRTRCKRCRARVRALLKERGIG